MHTFLYGIAVLTQEKYGIAVSRMALAGGYGQSTKYVEAARDPVIGAK